MQMTPKDASPQAAGSCLTYARRYSSAAVAGIGQEDDDGEAASAPRQHEKPAAKAPATKAASTTKPVAGIYTGTDTQQKIISEILKKKDVPEDLWGKIGDKLLGKPSTALQSVIDEVTELAASGAPY
jgi:hypothetical protein